MPTAGAARWQSGNHAPGPSTVGQSRPAFARHKNPHCAIEVSAQLHERAIVCSWCCTNEQVDGGKLGHPRDAYDLPETSFQAVAIDRGVPEPRHDDSHARMNKGGGGDPKLETPGPDPLPPLANSLDVRSPVQPMARRKAPARFRRLRTSTEALRSDASALSCDAGSALRAPTWWPCAYGSHASGCASCYGDDMSAFPCSITPDVPWTRKKFGRRPVTLTNPGR